MFTKSAWSESSMTTGKLLNFWVPPLAPGGEGVGDTSSHRMVHIVSTRQHSSRLMWIFVLQIWNPDDDPFPTPTWASLLDHLLQRFLTGIITHSPEFSPMEEE